MNLERSQSAPLQQAPLSDGVPGAAFPTGGPLTFSESQPFFRFDFARSLQLHRRLALGIALAGLALALAYTVIKWPLYIAQSQIYIQPQTQTVMQQGNNNDQHWPYDSTSDDSFIQQQVQLASNPAVLMAALHKLNPGAWQHAGETEQAAAERLGRSIKAERLGSSYQVAINARAPSAWLSAQIANAVATSIVERAAREENAGDPQRVAILTDERDRVQKQLNADLAEQAALNKELGMAEVGTQAPDLIDDSIAATRQALIAARTDHDQAEARFDALGAGHGLSSAALQAEADTLIASDAGLTSMKTSLNQRRATLITQMANLTPNNPEYKLDAQELAKINSSLDSMMSELRTKASERIEEGLRTDLDRTADVEAQLDAQLNQLAATAASATPKLQRANDVATDIVRLRNRYSAVDEELHNLMLQESVPGAVHLSVTAAPPLHPDLTGILKGALPLALGGLILGLLAALLAANLDPRVYIAADVEQVLGVRPMAVLPDFAEVSGGVAEEHLLRLASSMEHVRKQGKLKSCIFTGTASGTGVTTVVTRVRDMLEAMGRPTVLVDASGNPRSAPHAGGVDAHDRLAQAATQRGSRSTALLQQVTEKTKKREDSLVLTDTAPLAVSAETEYLARFVDCAIVVIESGVTTRTQLRETALTLQRLDVAAVGFVLNRIGMAKADPAFRRSVAGVEKHLREQTRFTPQRTRRTSLFESEGLPVPEPAPRAVSAYALTKPEVPAPSVEIAAPAVPTHPTLPSGPETAPEQEPRPPQEKAQAEESRPPAPEPVPASAPASDSDVPWWLTDGRPEVDATLSPAPAQPAGEFEPEPAAFYSAPPRSMDSMDQPQETPAPSWKHAVNGRDRASEAPEIAAPPAAQQEAQPLDPSPFDSGSRLSSLRNLLFSPGLKNLEKKENSAAQDSQSSLLEESVAEPPAFSRIPAPSRSFDPPPEPEPAMSARPAAASALLGPVTARPEILPPRPEPGKTGKLRELDSPARRDRGEVYDEVEILPSWRGQYKTRR